MATIANLMKLTESLVTEVKAMREEIQSLKAAPVKATKATKAKKEVDPDAPPKETSWWIKATQHVRDVLKAQITSDNEALVASGGKKLAGTVPIKVASMLKDAGQLSATAMPDDADILASYEAYKADPPASKKAGSVASDGSAGSSGTKFADMTEEEQTAARKARAIKAAATRKANKAAKAAEAASASEPEPEAVTPKKAPAKPKAPAAPKKAPAEVPEADMDMPFILNGKSYLRIENALWDAATDAWVGMYNPKTKAIDRKAAEPERAEA